MNEIKNEILLLGDIHANFSIAMRLANTNKDKTVIQIGDFGIGFQDYPSEINPITNLKFIHGNHDNPDRCVLYSGYLGRYGTFMWNNLKVFYISGAYSVDHMHRKPGRDWWHNEQLSRNEMNHCLELYKNTKPDIVISHDCPGKIWNILCNNVNMMFGGEKINNITSDFLSSALDTHRPKLWIFGHYHQNANFIFEDTKFVCIGTNNHISLRELL